MKTLWVVLLLGSTRVDSVYEDATYLVREGTYNVAVECGQYAGSEEITVARDTTAVFDVFEYGSGPIKKGWLTIHVDPLGAALYIDGVKTPYTDGVELEYGTYRFEFSEGGYTSYNATVLIDQPKQSLSVFLIEQKNEETNPDDNEDPTNDPNEPQEGGNTGEGENTNTGEDGGTGAGENTDGDNGENSDAGTGENTGNNSGDDPLSDIITSVSVMGRGYELDLDNAIYILGPVGSEIYLDGEYLGTAPMDFEKIIGSCLFTIIRTDGAVKNVNYYEPDNGEDCYFNFSWID